MWFRDSLSLVLRYFFLGFGWVLGVWFFCLGLWFGGVFCLFFAMVYELLSLGYV